MKDFFQFLQTGKPTNELTRRIDDAVSEAIRVDEWEAEFLKFELLMNQERQEGRKEGREEGRQEGQEIGHIEERIHMLMRFHAPEEQIIEELIKDFNLAEKDATMQLENWKTTH